MTTRPRSSANCVEEPELRRRQLGAFAVDERLHFPRVDPQLLDLDRLARGTSVCSRPPRRDAAAPRDELLHRERLDEVVVRPDLERVHAVVLGPAGADDEIGVPIPSARGGSISFQPSIREASGRRRTTSGRSNRSRASPRRRPPRPPDRSPATAGGAPCPGAMTSSSSTIRTFAILAPIMENHELEAERGRLAARGEPGDRARAGRGGSASRGEPSRARDPRRPTAGRGRLAGAAPAGALASAPRSRRGERQARVPRLPPRAR